ncbi:MAG: exopolysaccharide biosynthesis polyprenyl glycosylphosphotransferase [Candidatus Riflebacteria bacterium]|nr:exopolysaccharide biosynthesis polyprenyl glycosylphosphotransferase [Candidatus Riflebacteria bacterium]
MSHSFRWGFRVRLRQSAEWIFSLFLIVLDALIVNGIFIGVFEVWLSGIKNQEVYLSSYYQVRIWLFGLYLIFGAIFDIFRIRAMRAASDVFFHAIAALLSTFIAFNLLLFLSRPLAALAFTFPRPILLLSTAISIFATFVVRVILSGIFIPHPQLLRAVILGDEAEGKRILKHFHRRGGVRCRLEGCYRSDQLGELANDIVFRHVNEVIVTDSKLPLDSLWASIFYGRRVEPHDFKVRTTFDASSAFGNMDLSSLEDMPLNTIEALPIRGASRWIKRCFDILFSLFAIFLTAPIMAAAAIAVAIDSPGPIFYRQKRVGRFGREFDMLKFRSMRVGAEKGTGPKIATSDDPRTTRIGAFLRRTGIDELPQFFLVLIGEMSVVGPRPERPFFVDKHHEFQGRRLSVRPGVTGLAAVNSRYYLRLTDKVAYDYYYLDNYNIILDIKIIFQTIWVLLFKSDKALEDKHHALDRMGKPPENES